MPQQLFQCFRTHPESRSDRRYRFFHLIQIHQQPQTIRQFFGHLKINAPSFSERKVISTVVRGRRHQDSKPLMILKCLYDVFHKCLRLKTVMETPVGKCKSDRTRTYLPRLFVMRMTDQVIFPEIRSGLHQKRSDIPATVWYDTDIEFSTVQMPELLIYHFFLFFGIRCNVDIRILRHRLCVLIAFLHQFRKINMDNERDPQLSCFFFPVARLPGENIVCTDIFLNVRNVSNTQHMLPEQIHIKTVLSLQAFYQCPSFFPAAFKQCIRIIAHHSIQRKKRTSFLFDH